MSTDILARSLTQFYADEQNWDALEPYLRGKGDVSYRLLDFLVFHLSKTQRLQYTHNNRLTTINAESQMLLQAMQRRHFDPFKRVAKNRVLSVGPPGRQLDSTLPQLMFFRWALQKGVLEYAVSKQDEIREQMRAKRKRMPDEIVIELKRKKID